MRDDAEAEDVQDAYVKAHEHLNQFEGRANFSTWLSRIAFHEALARTRNKGRVQELEAIPENVRDKMQSLRSPAMSPEEEASNSEVRCLLEKEINALPDNYRSVLVLRDVEEIDAAEVAEILSITLENVKMRLFRARAFLRKRLCLRTGAHSRYTFLFHASRCDRVVITVFKKLGI